MSCVEHTQLGTKEGYGYTTRMVGGVRKSISLHRIAFLDNYGYLPEVVMHTCDNPRCINPNHLIAGTYKQNSQDMVQKNRNKGGWNLTTKELRTTIAEEANTGITSEELSTKYGLSAGYIRRIRREYNEGIQQPKETSAVGASLQ